MAFFEQLGKTINDASDSLKRKTQNFTEVNSLEKQVNSNQAVIQNMYAEIGRAYYEAHKADEQDVYAEQCRVITNALGQIAQLQDQIRIKKGIQLCPNCGAQLAPGSVFCAGCGAQVAAPAQQMGATVPQNGAGMQTSNMQASNMPAGNVMQQPVQQAGNVVPQAPVQPSANEVPQTPVQQQTDQTPQIPGARFCGQCGSQIPADSAFCPVCGQRI